MGKVFAFLGLVLALLWPTAATATTGGNGTLKVLGVAPGDGKLYLLHDVDDASEDLPQLSYVVLDGPNAGTIVEVRSWYRGFEDGDWDDEDVDRFYAKLERLEKRLEPAKTIAPACVAMPTVTERRRVADPWVPQWDTEYDVRIDVAHPTAPSQLGSTSVVAFGPKVEVAAEIRIPEVALAIVIVRYFAFPYEYGYHDDVAIAVPLSPAAQAAGERAPAVEYNPSPYADGYPSIDRFAK